MMLDWHIITRAEYDQGVKDGKANAAHLYFTSDTHEFFRGTDKFSNAVVLYTTESGIPAVLADNTIYFNTDTGEGKVKGADGSPITMIRPLGEVSAANTTNPVSGADVVKYVTEHLEADSSTSNLDLAVVKVEWDAANAVLTSTYGDVAASTQTLVFDGLAVDMSYDQTTGKLIMSDVSGNELASVDLGLEKFISSATYDAENKKIVLSFNDDTAPLEINVADLVDTYQFEDTDTVAFTAENNIVSANIVISTVDETGIYVPATDITGKADKISNALGGKVVLSTEDGGISESTVTIGSATVGEVADANVLATEAAVIAIKEALVKYVDEKCVVKFDATTAKQITIVGDDGVLTTSGVLIGGETFAETPSAGTVATEAGVAAYVADKAVAKTDIVATAADAAATVEAASSTKVVSEKVYVESHSWKTTM